MNSDIAEKIKTSFAAQSLMATFQARLDRVETGSVSIIAPILPIALQQQGFGHAGLTFALGDTAAGYAALSTLPVDSEVVTAEIKVNLLAPARGDWLRAEGKVVKPGRRLVVVTAEVFAHGDGQDRLVALLQGTMVPVPR